MQKMKPAIKRRWVAALRSGKYKQGRGTLRDRDMFCCLGVLCDLHRRSADGRRHKARWSNENTEYLGRTGALPEEVLEWAGLNLDEEDPILINSPEKIYSASDLNDNTYEARPKRRYTFKGIASIIEKNL